MTEMSPLGTYGNLKGKHMEADWPTQRALLLKQGRAVFGVDMKAVSYTHLDVYKRQVRMQRND